MHSNAAVNETPRLRLTKELKLNNTWEYKQVFRSAKRMKYKGLLACFAKNNTNIPRLGLVIRKKEIPLATGRNRFKRHIRESFRLHQRRLAGFDIIVRVTQRRWDVDNVELRLCLENLWKKLPVLDKNV